MTTYKRRTASLWRESTIQDERGKHRKQQSVQVGFADLFARLGGLPGSRNESGWEHRGEDAFGVGLDRRPSKLLGAVVTIRAHATFGGDRRQPCTGGT